jgi:FkbM family methyltransferase
MTFISYAQNFEDVLLWRALGHIPNGCYIDVGANDPVEHSVTKAFYDAGWHGINIEPLPAFHHSFLEQRPRDINLAVAAGAHEASITLFDVPAVNGWASNDSAVAAAHRAEGYAVTELSVPLRTLAGICAEHVRGDIHFLKIDVEGFEGEVLRGMDFGKWRPWLLVVEATMPNSRITNHETWEGMVTGARYRFAYFDGLNRYYVADEHPELLAALTIQPNVFDDFISHHLDKAWKAARTANRAGRLATEQANALLKRADVKYHEALGERDAAQAKVRELEIVNASLMAEVEAGLRLAAWAKEIEQRLTEIHSSRSWRLTRPLRAAARVPRMLRALRPADIALFLRQRLLRLVRRLTANERVRRLVIPLMIRFPALDAKVAQALVTIKQVAPEAMTQAAPAAVPEELQHMPAEARAVLADIERSIARGVANLRNE